MNNSISINKQVKPLVEQLIESHEKLNLSISESEGGAKIIDAGIKVRGCLEAGRIITEICMGGLGSVSLSMTNNNPNWPLSIHVHSTDPVLSSMCTILLSQCAASRVNDKQLLSSLVNGTPISSSQLIQDGPSSII